MITKKIVLGIGFSMLTIFSVSAQISAPSTSTTIIPSTSSIPSNSVGINTHQNKNKGTLHLGKKLSIDAESWSSASLQYNMYLDANKKRRIIHDNSHVKWGGVGRFVMHEYGFAFRGSTTRGVSNSIIPSEKVILRINYDGNVGINNNNPKAKLDVNGVTFIGEGDFKKNQVNADGKAYNLYVKGGIITEEMKVEIATGNWADYVFKKEYDLKSLEEVENYIQKKGHLHNTKSAEEYEKNGLELKSITINQQEKIEEIYLHLIEMNKEIKILQKENEKLKLQNEKLLSKFNFKL